MESEDTAMTNESGRDEIIRIPGQEREERVRGQVSDFPKYTEPLMNLANRYAQSTREPVVGNMTELLEEFQKNNPQGGYDEWRQFYLENHDGEERIEEATEKMLEMVSNFREALEEIDEEIAREYISELVLYRTYLGEDVKKVIFEKLGEVYAKDTKTTPLQSFDGYVGDVRVALVSEKYQSKEIPGEGVVPVYFKENKRDRSIDVDASELSEAFNLRVADNSAYNSLSNFSFSL